MYLKVALALVTGIWESSAVIVLGVKMGLCEHLGVLTSEGRRVRQVLLSGLEEAIRREA